MDKKLVAQNLRQHLERRLSTALGCAPEDLRMLKLGALVHLCFLVLGDQESISGFSTCIRGIIQLVGHEIVWADPEKPEDMQEEPAQLVIN